MLKRSWFSVWEDEITTCLMTVKLRARRKSAMNSPTLCSLLEIDSICTISLWKDRKGEALITSSAELNVPVDGDDVVGTPKGDCGNAGCGEAAVRAALSKSE